MFLVFQGAVNVINSTISGNRARFVGGVYGLLGSEIRITNSIISCNTGDGVHSQYGQLEIINSTVSNNGRIGVAEASREGGFFTVRGSTISGNSREGLYNASGNLIVTNSTISGNGYGIVGARDGLITLTHSTVTGNSLGGMVIAYAGEYGSYVTLNRSLISGNGRFEVSVTREDSPVTAGNFNVFGHSGNAGVTGLSPGPTDIVPAKPLKAILNTTLSNNGGFTRTHALVAGSPAIDAVNDGTCPPPPRDQRGIARPRDGNGDGGPACDIGAFER